MDAKELERLKALRLTNMLWKEMSEGISYRLIDHIAEQQKEIERMKNDYNKWADWLYSDDFRKDALELANDFIFKTRSLDVPSLGLKAREFKDKWRLK